jgi:hypothetical protein
VSEGAKQQTSPPRQQQQQQRKRRTRGGIARTKGNRSQDAQPAMPISKSQTRLHLGPMSSRRAPLDASIQPAALHPPRLPSQRGMTRRPAARACACATTCRAACRADRRVSQSTKGRRRTSGARPAAKRATRHAGLRQGGRLAEAEAEAEPRGRLARRRSWSFGRRVRVLEARERRGRERTVI